MRAAAVWSAAVRDAYRRAAASRVARSALVQTIKKELQEIGGGKSTDPSEDDSPEELEVLKKKLEECGMPADAYKVRHWWRLCAATGAAAVTSVCRARARR